MVLFFQNFIAIFIESAPWLILGFFIAGLIKAFVPTNFLHKHLGNHSISAVIKGAILGAPLPLCSCGVIPAALGIRRAGASKAATTSFLIATPETGVDSVSVTYALLGPFMAIVRPVAAVTTAITAGIAVLLFDKQSSCNHKKKAKVNNGATCCSKQPKPEPKTTCCSTKTQPQASSCCSSKANTSESSSATLLKQVRDGLAFTFIDLIKDTVVWLLLGLVLAALILTAIPPEYLTQWGSSQYAYIMMALIGVPMYICATASTPIAAGLLFAGVSPGAVLVFLLVGPATNIATLGIVKNELGSRVLSIYISVIVTLSFGFGWLTDTLSRQLNINMYTHIHNHQHTSVIATISAVALAGLLLNGLRKKYLQ